MKKFIWLLVCFAMLLFCATGWAKKEGELKALENPGFIEKPDWFKSSFLDLRDDIAEAADEGRRLLFYFYQDGCPYCKKLITINFTQKAIIDKTRQNFDVVAINMWGDREVTDYEGNVIKEKDFAAKHRVMFTPTLVFFNEKGEVALRLNGYFPPEKLMVALDYVSGKNENKMRFRDYLKEVNPVASFGKLHEKPYMSRSTDALVNRNKDYLAVFVEQKECPACDELHTDVLVRPETIKQISKFDVVQIDMWSKNKIKSFDGTLQNIGQWTKSLDIKYAPTIVLFDKHGKEVIRMEAYLKSFHVQSVLDYVSSGAYKKEPSFQRYIDERAEAIRSKGIEVNLMD